MKQKLLRLCRLDVLALVLALLTWGYVNHTHHRTQERINEIESVVNEGIHIPKETLPPVRLEPRCE